MTVGSPVGVPASAGPALILFDAVGTLIEPDPPVDAAYYNAGLGYKGLFVSRETIRARFREVFQANAQTHLADHAGQTSEEYELSRWSTIVRQVFAEAGDVIGELIFNRLWQHFAEPRHWKLFSDVELTIRELHRCGYQVGIASNFDQRLLAICRGHAPLAEIEPIFISSQVGWSKPAPEFYRHIEAVTNLPPDRILLVGDDWENDVTAPQALGWRARWLDRTGTRWKGNPITSLTQLLDELP